jgi:serine/threonine protein kinase
VDASYRVFMSGSTASAVRLLSILPNRTAVDLTMMLLGQYADVPLSDCAVAVGDFTDDGLVDILYSGMYSPTSRPVPLSILLTCSSNGSYVTSFTDTSGDSLPLAGSGQFAVVDLANSGQSQLFSVGYGNCPPQYFFLIGDSNDTSTNSSATTAGASLSPSSFSLGQFLGVLLGSVGAFGILVICVFSFIAVCLAALFCVISMTICCCACLAICGAFFAVLVVLFSLSFSLSSVILPRRRLRSGDSFFFSVDLPMVEFERALSSGLTGLQRIEVEDISLSEHEIYHTRWPTVLGSWLGVEVAIQRFDSYREDEAAVRSISQVMLVQSKISHHPNLALHAGLAFDDDCVFLVRQHFIGGSLFDLLQRPDFMDWSSRIFIARDVVSAVAFLHGEGVVHGSLRPSTVLLGPHLRASVSGLGDWVVVTEEEATVVSAIWFAPELARTRAPSTPADMWSLGLLILEIAAPGVVGSTLTPIANARGMGQLAGALGGVDELTTVPPEWLALARVCLNVDPSARPLASDILRSLQAMGNMFQNAGDSTSADGLDHPQGASNDSSAYAFLQSNASTLGAGTISAGVMPQSAAGASAGDMRYHDAAPSAAVFSGDGSSGSMGAGVVGVAGAGPEAAAIAASGNK